MGAACSPWHRKGCPADRNVTHLPECVLEHDSVRHIWHVAAGKGDSTFQPILCDDVEGINMPGNRVARQPTCVECYRIWRVDRSTLGEGGC